MAWIKVSEARERLDGAVSVQTLYRLAKKGELVGTRIAGKVLIDSASLDDLIERGGVAIRTGFLPPPTRRKRRAG